MGSGAFLDYKIQWSGNITGWDEAVHGPHWGSDNPSDGIKNIVWGGNVTHTPCWYDVVDDGSCTDSAGCGLYSECEAGIPSECHSNPQFCFQIYGVTSSLYFEDFDLDGDGDLSDYNNWVNKSIIMFWYQRGIYLGSNPMPENTPKKTYTWGDIALALEIFYTGGDAGDGDDEEEERRRLREILGDADKRKRLIRLICRVKGIKVYDETKQTGDYKIHMRDVRMVVKEVLGAIKVENVNVL